MKNAYFILLTLTLLSCRNGIRGSGNIITETRQLSDINSVSVSGDIKVDVKNGSVPSLIIEADDNILPYVVTDISDRNLSIKLKGISNVRNASIRIHIVGQNLLKFKTSASAEINSTEIISSADKLTFAASSNSQINVQVDAPVISADASSGAEITLFGRTKTLTAESSSGSEVNLFALQAENVSAKASSGASISVFASVSLSGNASSGGNVKYKGGATSVQKNISSGGSVNAE